MAVSDRLRPVCQAVGLDPQRTRRAIEFSAVGATGAVVDLGSTLLLLGQVHYLLANTIGFLLAVTWNFAGHWAFVFDRPDGHLGWQYASYVVLHVATFVARVAVVTTLVELAGTPAAIATVVGIAVAAVCNFLGTERIFDGLGEYWFDVIEALNQLAHSIYSSRVRTLLRATGTYALVYGVYMRVLASMYPDDTLRLEVGPAAAEISTATPPEIVSVLHTLEKERPVIERFLADLGDEAVVWDVGANLGVYSVLAGAVADEVIAFEPVPETADRCEANLQLNQADGEVLQLALADQWGVTELALERDELGTQTPRLGDETDSTTRTVAIADGDSLLDERDLPSPDAIKIDVEGAEVAALEGLQTVLSDHAEFVLVELHGRTGGIWHQLAVAGFDVEPFSHADQDYLVGEK